MKFLIDKLTDGYRFPCKVADLKRVIKSLPPEDICGIHSIRLSGQKGRVDGMCLCDGRIELRWAVDSSGRRRVGKRPPSAATVAEWSAFGGQCVVAAGVYYGFWPDPRKLRRYVLFVLLHEIGHHTCDFRRTEQEAEAFADAYAEKYLSVLGENTEQSPAGDVLKAAPDE